MRTRLPSHLLLLTPIILTGCSELMNGAPLSMGGFRSGGKSISPTQVLSVGEDLYKAATLSDEDVQRMAKEQIAVMDAQNKVAAPGDPYAKRLEKLSVGLKHEDGLNLNYKVYLTSDINAFSMADGSIRVYSALMDKFNDDELKFILGHEIAHVKHGHRKARLQRAYAASAAVNAADAGVKASTGSSAARLGGEIVATMAAEVLTGQFSQGDETECDEYGLHLLAKYNLPKEASVAALIKLGEAAGGGSADLFSSLTSSHPDPIARAKHMQELIPELAGQPDLTAGSVQVAKADVAPADDDQASVVPVVNNDAGAVDVSEEAATESAHSHAALANAPAAQLPKGNAQGWYIQVGAFANRASAQRINDSLKDAPQGASLQEGALRGQRIYRVVVGPFESRQAAQEELESVASQPNTTGAFVRKLPEKI